MKLSVIPGADHYSPDDALSGRPRAIAIAAILVAIFLTGVAAGRSFGPESGVPTTDSQASAPQPAQEFVYFPSQYVNQGKEIPEAASTF